MNKELTDKLARIKSHLRRALELGEKATAGPWTKCLANKGECSCGQIHDKDGFILRCYCADNNDDPDPCPTSEAMQANAAFIAHTRTGYPLAATIGIIAIEALIENERIERACGAIGTADMALTRLQSIADSFPEEVL